MSKKKIAILLNGPIANDYRVIKTINSIKNELDVYLFYLDGTPEDALIFDDVTLFPHQHNPNFYHKILRHSFFCHELNILFTNAIDTRIKFDFVWANDLPCLVPGYKLAKKQNIPLIYDSHEIFIETLNQFFPRDQKGPKKIIFSFFLLIMKIHGYWVEKRIIPKTSHFITVNQSILDYFANKYNLPIGRSVIMNTPILYNTPSAPIDYRELYEWKKDDIVIIYQGTMNDGRGLNLLVDSLYHSEKHIKLVFVGDGPILNNLLNQVSKLQLSDRVKFIPKQPLNKLSSYTTGADFGVVLLETYNISTLMASPNKLFEYIHANLPVIASNTDENQKVFSKYEIGYLVNNTHNEIVQLLNNLDHTNLELFKDNELLAKQYYNWQNQEVEILSIFNR